jgi:hypothetical protein
MNKYIPALGFEFVHLAQGVKLNQI